MPVIELLVAVGDTVKQDQGLVTLESDKATMEVPAPFAGVVRELKVKIGDKLAEGSVVAMIEASERRRRRARARRRAAARRARCAASHGRRRRNRHPGRTGRRARSSPTSIAQQSIDRSGAPVAALDSRPGIDPEAAPPPHARRWRSPPTS